MKRGFVLNLILWIVLASAILTLIALGISLLSTFSVANTSFFIFLVCVVVCIFFLMDKINPQNRK